MDKAILESAQALNIPIDSRVIITNTLPDFDQQTVKNEPMLFSCSTDFARESGGPITRAFLDALTLDEDPAIVDTRVHMLMPGWFPCIPGWHHDDVPRSRSDGQPNYIDPEYRPEHAMALVNGDICPTEFAIGRTTMPDVPLGQTIYQVWDQIVEQRIKAGILSRFSAPSNRVIYFDDESFHRGTVAVRGGWRWFGRITWNSHRKFTNEIRKQVQVYMPVPEQGW